MLLFIYNVTKLINSVRNLEYFAEMDLPSQTYKKDLHLSGHCPFHETQFPEKQA